MFAKTAIVAAFAGLVASEYTSSMGSYDNQGGEEYPTSSYKAVPTTTKVVNQYITYCPVPTVVTMNDKYYTVSQPTTLTINDCPCTVTEPCYTCAPTAYPKPSDNSYPDNSYNKPDEKKDDYSKPDEKKDSYNKPDEKKDTYSKPDEKKDTYNNNNNNNNDYKKDDKKDSYKPVEVAGADARHIAYGLAMALAGVVGYVALL
ncbi:hypothetical protein XA68_18457 [Ophiocordyceps unilateralis]|uniref:Uncharacterized protein n=1 Tax=Ophiocordyceps unilateralis TaxID=268505 RepID=A0A2A9PIE0_OPHUN|nr:hypothetical protein XA68_18457 [Ophiocordyceps unilateralis]